MTRSFLCAGLMGELARLRELERQGLSDPLVSARRLVESLRREKAEWEEKIERGRRASEVMRSKGLSR